MKISGIYGILNIVNNYFYIGSAINISNRIYSHLMELRKGKHRNSILQRAYKKYGEQSFHFFIVERVKFKENLTSREQFWIDYYESQNDYNICVEASSSLGVVRTPEFKRKLSKAKKGKKLTPEHCRKVSEALMGHAPWTKGRKFTKQHRDKISKANKGRTTWSKGKTLSEETKRKMSEARMGHKGCIHSDETKEKLSQHFKKHPIKYWLGKKRSEETKRKMSIGRKGIVAWNKGMSGHLSEETLKKMSDSHKKGSL